MTELRDRPRPAGYWPNTPSQWREPSVDDCTWYATEFAYEAASENYRSVHPVLGLRNFSSDKVGGTPVHVALRDTQSLWPSEERVTYDYYLAHPNQVREHLKRGATIVWGGDYEKLPPHYRRWTNNDTFNHAMASRDLDHKDWTFLYDPLGGGPQRDPYDGEWIPLEAMFRFSWGHSGKVEIGVVENRGDEPMNRVHLFGQHPTDKEVRTRSGTEVRRNPRSTGEITRRFHDEEKWRPLIGNANGGWRLVGWGDLDLDNTNIGYVHADDILEVKEMQYPDTENCDEQEALLLQYEVGIDIIRETTAKLP